MKSTYDPYTKHTERLRQKRAAIDNPSKKRRPAHTETPPPPMGVAAVQVDRIEIDTTPKEPEKPALNFGISQEFVNRENRKKQHSFAMLDYLREAQPERAGDNRLVNTRKSPTNHFAINDRPSVARVFYRDWSDEYRVSVDSVARLPEPPPVQSGERITSHLTENAARKITDAGAYVAAVKGGFKTFGTLTFDTESRERITKPVCQKVSDQAAGTYCGDVQSDGQFTAVKFEPISTIGREASRFFDAMQKRITRGWTWEPSKAEKKELLNLWEPVKFEGRKEKLNYIWVAENPDNTNPHVHFLIDWGVEPEFFKGWAEQLEELWGCGFNHLERIRCSKAAAGYLLKALGYVTKGAHEIDPKTGELVNSQGIIKGNRYGISSEARAPDWECIAEYDANIMGQVIKQIGEQAQAAAARVKQQIIDARAMKDAEKGKLARLKNYNNMPERIRQRKIQHAKKRLENAENMERSAKRWRETNPYGGKYRMTFRGKRQLDSFIEFAVVQRGWMPSISPHAIGKSHIVKEAKQIASWAARKAAEVAEAIRSKFYDFENYMNQILHDGEPPTPLDFWETATHE